MQLELLARRGQREHLVVQLLERRARRAAAAAARRRGRRGCRPARRAAPNANSSTQAAVLRPTPGSATSSRAPPRAAAGSQSSDSSPASPAGRLADRAQDRLDARGLDLGDAARADRLLDLGDAARRARPPTRQTRRAGAGRRRRGCGRWSTATARSARARRSGGRAAASAARRRRRAGVAHRAHARPRRRRPAARRVARSRTRRVTPIAGHASARYFRSVPAVSDQRGEITPPAVRRPDPALLAQRSGRRARAPAALPARRADQLRRLAAVSGAHRRPRPRPAGLRALGQARATSTTRSTVRRFLERFLDHARARASQPGRARLGRGRPGLAQRHARADRAARDDQRRAVAARLPLAPHRAGLAHADARRVRRWG